MDNSTDDRSGGLSVNGTPSSGVTSSLVITPKLLVVLSSVVILSLSTVACTIFFIWMCFLHPAAATTILPILIPAGLGGLLVHFGKKAQELLSIKDDKNSTEKESK
jgi:hypothetical protein